jgi:stearoyl-CoA desaturase (delta-9 desaturase)
MSKFPWRQVNWLNTVFLFGTLIATLTAVPYYIWKNGLELYQAVMFLFFFIATGISITLGYHRLFSHLSFQATWPVKLFTLLFGAAAFENSALAWCADHRMHHKHTDNEPDPYDISRGFWHAHIGWILFRLKPESPMSVVKDLQADKLVMWQHNHYVKIAMVVGFVIPTVLGYFLGGWNGALGALLMSGIARIVFVHHMTFFINSLCHTLGSRPYDKKVSARDSALMAVFTFGEGYHNFHHTFQHDYRNGVKAWQWDPTKWAIILLNKLGLVKNLRKVDEAKIREAEVRARNKELAEKAAGDHPLEEVSAAALISKNTPSVSNT